MTTETKPASSISVSARTLHRMLTAVLPHTGRDNTLPALQAVSFEVRAGVLYLAATDRYTLGVAREVIPGALIAAPDLGALLARKSAKALRRMLRKADGVAAITLSGDRMSVDCGTGTTGSWATVPGEFPGWRKMLARMLDGEQAPLGDGFGMDLRNVAKFAKADSPSWADALSLRVTVGGQPGDDTKPAPSVLFARGDWFIGALMPVRRAESTSSEGAKAWDEWSALGAAAEKVPADA